jgi:hypothetical protein
MGQGAVTVEPEERLPGSPSHTKEIPHVPYAAFRAAAL